MQRNAKDWDVIDPIQMAQILARPNFYNIEDIPKAKMSSSCAEKNYI